MSPRNSDHTAGGLIAAAIGATAIGGLALLFVSGSAPTTAQRETNASREDSIAGLRTENAELRERIRRLLLLQNDPDKLPKSDDAPPPSVEGLVLNTRKARAGSYELVEISIGSDDGLEMGDRLFVYDRNAGKYFGLITIVHITPDRAVGSVTARAKYGTIEQGHNVSTKL